MKTFFMWVGILFTIIFVLALIVGGNSSKVSSTPSTNTSESAKQEAIAAASEAVEAAAEAQAAVDAANKAENQNTTVVANSNLTNQQRNAVRAAEQYIDLTGFSRKGLIDQLSSSAGDGFSYADAKAAVDSMDVDWNQEAVEAAQQYIDLTGFSCSGLIDQLSPSAGDRFTEQQARYGAQQVGACS